MKSIKLGNADFVAFMSQGHPEWGVFCLNTKDHIGIDLIASTLGWSLRSNPSNFEVYDDLAEEVDKMAEFQNLDWSPFDCAGEIIPVVRMKGSNWLNVLFSIGHCHGAGTLAKKISKQLNTKVVTFWGHNTSGARGYAIYQKGEATEGAESCDAFGETIDDDFDSVFRGNGIYIPACFPLLTNQGLILGFQGVSEEDIGEVFILEK